MTTQLPPRVKEAMLTAMCESESIRAYASRTSVPIEEYHIALAELRKAHEELHVQERVLQLLAYIVDAIVKDELVANSVMPSDPTHVAWVLNQAK